MLKIKKLVDLINGTLKWEPVDESIRFEPTPSQRIMNDLEQRMAPYLGVNQPPPSYTTNFSSTPTNPPARQQRRSIWCRRISMMIRGGQPITPNIRHPLQGYYHHISDCIFCRPLVQDRMSSGAVIQCHTNPSDGRMTLSWYVPPAPAEPEHIDDILDDYDELDQ